MPRDIVEKRNQPFWGWGAAGTEEFTVMAQTFSFIVVGLSVYVDLRLVYSDPLRIILSNIKRNMKCFSDIFQLTSKQLE